MPRTSCECEVTLDDQLRIAAAQVHFCLSVGRKQERWSMQSPRADIKGMLRDFVTLGD